VAANAYPLPGLDCLNVTTAPARRRPIVEAASRVWQVRLDSHLTSAIAVLTAASHGDRATAARPLPAPADHAAAESLCAIIRTHGAACTVGR
jgi:hypothetical protein